MLVCFLNEMCLPILGKTENVFESHPRQTKVVKSGSDNSTAKRSAMGVCYGSLEKTIINGFPVP